MGATEKIQIDAYVIDSMMPDLAGHDRRASAFIVYLYLWRRTRGGARSTVVSHQMLVDGTGLAKRSVQEAVRWLARRRLISVTRRSPTAASTIMLRCHWRTSSADLAMSTSDRRVAKAAKM